MPCSSIGVKSILYGFLFQKKRDAIYLHEAKIEICVQYFYGLNFNFCVMREIWSKIFSIICVRLTYVLILNDTFSHQPSNAIAITKYKRVLIWKNALGSLNIKIFSSLVAYIWTQIEQSFSSFFSLVIFDDFTKFQCLFF